MGVGRENELSGIIALVEAVVAGESRAVEISGVAGIGKTTLVNDVLEALQTRHFEVWPIRTSAAEQVLQWSALRGLSAHLEDADGMPPSMATLVHGSALEIDPSGAGYEFAHWVATRAAQRRLCIIVEDAMWTDASSAGFLLAAMRTAKPIMWIVTRRTETESPFDLQRVLASGATAFVNLRGLSFTDATEFVQLCAPRAWTHPELQRLYHLSEGHPLFLRELATGFEQLGQDGVIRLPQSLQSLYRRQLKALDEAALAALKVAALAFRPTVALIQQAIPEASAGLDACERAQLISVHGQRIEFRHALIRHAVTELTGGIERQQVWRTLALNADDLCEQAEYRSRCSFEPNEEVASLLEQAADIHMTNGAVNPAQALYQRAADLTPPTLSTDLDRRLLACAEAAHSAGAWSDALTIASQLLERAPDSTALAVGRVYAGAVRRLSGVAPAVIAAESLVFKLADLPVEQARARVLLCDYLAHQNPRRAAAVAQEVVDCPASDGNPRLRHAAAVRVAFYQAVMGEVVDVPTLAAEARSLEIPVVELASLIALASCLGHPEIAEPWCLEMLEEGRLGGHIALASFAWDMLAEMAFRSGNWTEMIRCAEQSRSYGSVFGTITDAVSSTEHARVMAVRGDAVADLDALSKELLASPDDPSMTEMEALANLGTANLAVNRTEVAVKLLRKAVIVGAATGLSLPLGLPFEGDLIEGLVKLGELDEAVVVVEAFEHKAARTRNPSISGEWARVAGLVAAAQGDAQRARALFDTSLARHAIGTDPFLRARALLDRSAFLRRQRARADARAGLTEAMAVFALLGAATWIRRCEAEVERLGSQRDANELTASEQQMADRACTGQSNQEIAREMIVSLRTVESTLTRVYRKLGVRSRAQMIALHR